MQSRGDGVGCRVLQDALSGSSAPSYGMTVPLGVGWRHAAGWKRAGRGQCFDQSASEALVLRAEKAQVISDLNAVFNETGVVVVTQYRGLTVPEVTMLRSQMRQQGASFKVTKNRLTVRAIAETGFAELVPLFRGPTAIAYSRDPVAAAKVAVEYAKKNDKLQIIGGGLAGSILSVEQVRALAELPSLDDLRAKLIALINTPASRLVGLLQAPGGQLARLLQAKSDQGAAA